MTFRSLCSLAGGMQQARFLRRDSESVCKDIVHWVQIDYEGASADSAAKDVDLPPATVDAAQGLTQLGYML